MEQEKNKIWKRVVTSCDDIIPPFREIGNNLKMPYLDVIT